MILHTRRASLLVAFSVLLLAGCAPARSLPTNRTSMGMTRRRGE